MTSCYSFRLKLNFACLTALQILFIAQSSTSAHVTTTERALDSPAMTPAPTIRKISTSFPVNASMVTQARFVNRTLMHVKRIHNLVSLE